MIMPKRIMEDAGLPSLSVTEALIMELLLAQPATELYGLELVRASGNRVKRGTVYVTLSRMEEKGYIESREEERQPNIPGLPRRLYRVTGYGQRVYELLRLAREARLLLAGGEA
jgi:PadR family transcriptional regulator, regulatory protein PadR